MTQANGHDKQKATGLSISDRDGKVVWTFSQPTQVLALEPQNAFEIAEATARAAHTARFGEVPNDANYIAAQVRARVTEQLRDRMVVRVKAMLPSLMDNSRSLDYIAAQVVDTIFAEVA